MVKIQNTDNIKCWRGYTSTETLTYCCWKCKILQQLWKTVWNFLTKLNILLPYDPEIMLLSIQLNELKAYVHTKPCTHMFIATLFILAKN